MEIKLKKFKSVLLVSFIILMLAFLGFYLSIYRSKFNLNIFNSYESEYLNFIENSRYIFMTPKNNVGIDTGIIFYPGGLVDEKSYLPLLVELCKDGYGVYILKSPFKLPILNQDGAENIIKENYFSKYVLMGHCLGGTSMLKYFSKQTELSNKIKDIILLASYSDGSYIFDSTKNDNYRRDIDMLSIVGTNDKIIDIERYEHDKSNLDRDTKYLFIDGGNHSYFGNYGKQRKDGEATISIEQQQHFVLNEVEKFLNESK